MSIYMYILLTSMDCNESILLGSAFFTTMIRSQQDHSQLEQFIVESAVLRPAVSNSTWRTKDTEEFVPLECDVARKTSGD